MEDILFIVGFLAILVPTFFIKILFGFYEMGFLFLLFYFITIKNAPKNEEVQPPTDKKE